MQEASLFSTPSPEFIIEINILIDCIDWWKGGNTEGEVEETAKMVDNQRLRVGSRAPNLEVAGTHSTFTHHESMRHTLLWTEGMTEQHKGRCFVGLGFCFIKIPTLQMRKHRVVSGLQLCQ